MNKSDINVVRPKNLGWLEYKLTSKEMDYVWRCIENKKEKWNARLAGNISSSYLLMDRSDWFWLNAIKPLVAKYAEEFENMGENIPTIQSHPYHLSKWWVNYQHKHEFNPLHDHSGVYSFVIWMKIPTSFSDQKKNPFANQANDNSISNFLFQYLNILGQSTDYRYEMSPEWEGTLLFFPSQLLHVVYPFYDCDEDRISVSGNIKLNTMKRL